MTTSCPSDANDSRSREHPGAPFSWGLHGKMGSGSAQAAPASVAGMRGASLHASAAVDRKKKSRERTEHIVHRVGIALRAAIERELRLSRLRTTRGAPGGSGMRRGPP